MKGTIYTCAACAVVFAPIDDRPVDPTRPLCATCDPWELPRKQAAEVWLLEQMFTRSAACVVVALLAGILAGLPLAAAAVCVRLQVRPQILLRRGDVDVQTRVARHSDHRALRVSWDSDVGAAGSRTFALDGSDQDRVLFALVNVDQPAGSYRFEARVLGAGGQSLGVDRAAILSPEPQ